MLKTDLMLALRSLRRRARYALTNGLGSTLGLAVGTVTWQSLTTARVDPARVLRSE